MFFLISSGCGTPEGEAAQRNPYFYEELCEADQITLSTKAQYYDPDTMVETDIHIQGYKVKTYREGSLYRLTIEPVGDLEQERLNLYFYVTAEKIYRVWTDIVQGDEPVCLCGNDTLLTGILDTDEKLKENSEIVCQLEDASVVPGEGESGLRYEIHRSGNRITYSRSDVQPNGEKGFYEWFAWEKGSGLVEYGSGFKAEADILYLYDITVETRQGESGDVTAYSPLQETQGLLDGDEVLDLGSHMVAYHVPGEEIDKMYGFRVRETFQGAFYIAIQDLDNDAVWYLPDVYGRIMEMEYIGGDTGGGVVNLRYIPNGGEEIEEVCIPVYSPERDERMGIDIFSHCPRRKTIIGTQEGLEAGSGTLPRKVWEEAFQLEGEEYTVSFERVSPIYDPGYESGEIDADYRLTVRDGAENILSQQMVFHYPVRFEEVYWLVDFSGDGFSDIAFCTDLFRGGKHGSWSVLKLLIWNADAGCYEEERINGAPNLPMWNMDTASLVTCADTRSDSEIYWSKEMYAWIDGRWRRTGRFERVYSESEFSDTPGEGEKHPYADGYRELVYSGGELVAENRIEKDFYENDAFWFEESCIWSDNYKNGIKLYPDWPEWEKVETEVGGIILQKYVRAVSGTD